MLLISGGDDVHQLCEAQEEEFLEIMALVGMASKPLHVRRLQKALQDYVQNPGRTIYRIFKLSRVITGSMWYYLSVRLSRNIYTFSSSSGLQFESWSCMSKIYL